MIYLSICLEPKPYRSVRWAGAGNAMLALATLESDVATAVAHSDDGAAGAFGSARWHRSNISRRDPSTSMSTSQRCGPLSIEETFKWPAAWWEALESYDTTHGTQFAANLLQIVKDGLLVSTDYSGMGGAEETLRMLVRGASEKYNDPSLLQSLTTVRAGDVKPYCRRLLACQCGCVFGDILKRTAPATHEEFQSIKAKYTQEVAECGGKSRVAAQTIGPRLLKEAMHVFGKQFKVKDDSVAQMKAFCFKHQGHCHFFTLKNIWFPHGIRGRGRKEFSIIIAGIICTTWSSVGKHDGWLGDSLGPFCQFIQEVKHAKFDFVMLECVQAGKVVCFMFFVSKNKLVNAFIVYKGSKTCAQC